jgi:NRAMP (natural resistance-associated macrophage protein)-like metal ion transporter
MTDASTTLEKVRTERGTGRGQRRLRWLRALGPGLVTGAADDDPSGIATYSQAGAQFGFSISWTMLLSYPLMTAIQEVSARIGRTTGRGIAGNIRAHYSRSLLHAIVGLLFVANTINIGADLGAMGDAVALLIGGPRLLYAAVLGVLCAGLQIFMRYARYASILKYLTLALFAYFAAVAVVHVPWGEAVHGLLVPSFSSHAAFWTMVVAVFGTTISPYLFFWQASQEVEDIESTPGREPLLAVPRQGVRAAQRIRIDTYIGMGFSNLVALAIIIVTAATLHATGATDIQTSDQAARALRPIAGNFAFLVFTLGIVGTGLLAVPVLAGSAAYAIGEARGWSVGLTREPSRARAFYATLAAATLLGITINFSALNPIKALFWTAVINGVVAVPVMATMMRVAANPQVMGAFTVGGPLRFLGWAATLLMAAAAAAMLLTAL